MPAKVVMIKNDGAITLMDVLLEPGNIKVDLSNGPDNITYSGSALQQQFTDWRIMMQKFEKSLDQKWFEIYQAMRNNDKIGEKKIRKDVFEIEKEKEEDQFQFLRKYNQSIVSGIVLKDYVTPEWKNIDKAEIIYSNFNADIKKLPEVQKFYEGLIVAKRFKKGEYFQDFALPDSSGKLIQVSSFKGKYLLIDFWASNCLPCRYESPVLREAFKKYSDSKFQILSVSFDQNINDWKKTVIKDQYIWMNVIDSIGFGPKGKFSSQFNIMSIPRNLLLGKDGKIIATSLRGEELMMKLEAIFEKHD